MSAYWIGEHDIKDEVAFAEYLRQAISIIERFGGRRDAATDVIIAIDGA
jgi:uncharacterized protein (DUF1330 family)